MPGPREDQTDLKLTEIALPLPAECGIKGIDHSTRCLKKKKKIGVWLFCLNACLFVCMQYLCRPEGGVGSLGLELCCCWESNLSPVAEKPLSCLQHHNFILYFLAFPDRVSLFLAVLQLACRSGWPQNQRSICLCF